MISKLRAAVIGALLALPLCVQAQTTPAPKAPADPADPNAPVPPIVYAPLDSAAPRAKEDAQATPDKAWRAANAVVGATPSHAAHEAHGAAQEQAGPKPAPADHGKHH